MFLNKIKNKNKGSLMIDIVVAVSIISCFMLVAFNVAQKAISMSNQVVRSAQSAYLLEEGAESIKIFRDNNTWTNFVNFFDPSYTYCLPETVSDWNSPLFNPPCSKINGFTRTVNVMNVNRDTSSGDIVYSGGVLDPGTKLFTISVSWSEGGSILTKDLKFFISDIFLQ